MAKARRRALFATACLLALWPDPALAQDAAPWAAVAGPAAGAAASIGSPLAGCLAGGMRLSPDGPGWQAVRLGRNRHWGHPETIGFIASLGRAASQAGLPAILVGDLSQPRGGPMPFGHASHQNGLDADIWLDVTPRPPLDAAAREDWPVPSLVRPDRTIDPARYRSGHRTLIALAASQPGVDRVLVNPAIKQAMCRSDPGAPWLRLVRPWWGHDSHMHVRLRCPARQPECRDAPPPPPGDGCDASLAWWFTPEALRPASRPPGPPATLPATCRDVIEAR